MRWPSRQPRWPALVMAGLSVIVMVVFYGIPRFRIPTEVVIVLGAAVSLEALYRIVLSRLGPRRPGGGEGGGDGAG